MTTGRRTATRRTAPGKPRRPRLEWRGDPGRPYKVPSCAVLAVGTLFILVLLPAAVVLGPATSAASAATPLTATSPAPYFPISPVRIVDTRCSQAEYSFCANEHLPAANAGLHPLNNGLWSSPGWTSPQQIASSGITEISCAIDGYCAAIDSNGNFLSYQDGSWSNDGAVSLNGYTLTGISCASSSFCVVVAANGNAYGTSTSGGPVHIDSHNGLTAVSCTSSSFCMAVDNGGDAISYNGTTWSSAVSIDTKAGSSGLTSISCPTSSFCVAVDGNGNALTFNGASWSAPQSIAGSSITSVSCPTTTFCMAVDGNGNALTWNGTSWSVPQSIDPSSYGLTSVSCPTSSFCVAVDGGGNALTWNGTSWSQAITIDSFPSDGGNGGGYLYSVSCVSASFCMAVDVEGYRDNSGYVVTYNGTSWSVPQSVDPNAYLNSVSCPSASFCVAVDNYGNALEWNGTSWSAPQSIAGSSINSISCPTSSFCVAVDGNGYALTWNGTSWSAPVSIDPNGGGLLSVSCPSATFCVAVDNTGNALTWNGQQWSAPQSIDPNGYLNSVSCPTSSFCAAVDGNGNALTFNGASWSAPQSIAGSSIISVSCPTSSFCVAVDQDGNALTWNGSSWSLPVYIDLGYYSLGSVSCISAAICVAVDGNGNAYAWNGTSWSAPQSIDPGDGLISVSCPSSTFCMAVDNNGNALSYVPNTTDTAQVAGVDGVPSDATAAIMNVTVTGTTSGGYLSVYPAGEGAPSSSNLNWSAGETVANLVEVPLSASGQVVFALGGASGSANVVADLEGYVATGSGSTSGESFSSMPPERIVDTRCLSSAYSSANASYCQGIPDKVSPASSIPAHSSVTIGLPSSMASAQAVVANMTVTDASSGGYLSAYPAGTTTPTTSSLNFTPGETVANRIEVPVSSGGLSIYNGSSAPVDVVLDVNGFYTSGSSGALFSGETPQRIVDTRCSALPPPPFCTSENLPSQNSTLGTLPAHGSITVHVGGVAGVPSSATALVGNLTAVGPGAGGYLTLYPAGATRPVISDVNFQGGQPAVPNLVVAKLGSSGEVSIYNGSSGPVDVVLDVVGWYSG